MPSEKAVSNTTHIMFEEMHMSTFNNTISFVYPNKGYKVNGIYNKIINIEMYRIFDSIFQIG